MTEHQEESVPTPGPEATPASSTLSLSLSHHKKAQSGRRLFSTGLLVLATALCYYAFTAKVEDPIHKWFGLLIIVGASIPALVWAKRNDNRFPVFEVFMLTGVNTYAVPLLSGHSQLKLYPLQTITTAAFCILVYQMV